MIFVIVNGQKVKYDNLTYTCADPGGYETCSFTITKGNPPVPGSKIEIIDSLGTCWLGYVEEPGQRHQGHADTADVNGIGIGADLKLEPFGMIYVDRDLSKWGAASRARQIALLAAGFQPNGSVEVAPDATSVALKTFITGPWTSTQKQIVEAWFDAGPNCNIAKIATSVTGSASIALPDVNWNWNLDISSDDIATVLSGIALAASSLTASGTVTGNGRYGLAQEYYNAAGGGDGVDYSILWDNLIVVGDHGLTLTGTGTSQGILLTDIVQDVLKRSKLKVARKYIDYSSYVVTHSSYQDLTTAEQYFTDLKNLLGWHWGVWSAGAFSSEAAFYFVAPPTHPTGIVKYNDCAEVDVTERYSAMHNKIVATYKTPAGKSGKVTVSSPHPRIPHNVVHILAIDVGITQDSVSATTLAAYYLKIDQLNSAASGSAILPPTLLNGKVAHKLRPGMDRIRILGLPNSGNLLSVSPGNFNDLRVSRISVTVTAGNPTTQVEFDHGADLLEVLQARSAILDTTLGV